MKKILTVILVLAQLQFAKAQNTNTNESALKKCSKEFCMEPIFNEALKRYCEMAAPDEFDNQVDDWGPNVQSPKGECWCSCKNDVKGN